MRILAIRGQNLASLAQSFEIDLTAEPLAGTGLFAITGETGAGKSTILDALCLALYGSYPRAAVDKREKIVDPSDVAVQVSDPRNILTRGAGEGFAEVDFVGADGMAYRATWTVRRARAKATGRLQNVERKLERCDGTLQLATGIEPVLSAVVEKTGFTFEEFRRSVLLAQGEFDAFLLADETQRAALLEKITGTEVYSRISKRVFEETSTREAALKMLEADRDRIGLRTDAERAADEAREAAALQARATAETELAGITELLQRASDVSALRRRIADLTLEVTAAQQAVDEAGAIVAKAEAARAEQETASTAVDAEVAALEPLWQEALLLDARIAGAVSRRDDAARALDDAKRAEVEAAEHLQQLQREKVGAEDRQARAREALARDGAHATLAEAETRVSAALADYSRLNERLRAEGEAAQRAALEIQRLAATVAQSEAVLASGRDDKDKLARRIEERRAALAAMDDTALSEREGVLLAADAQIGQALEAVRDRDRAVGLIASANLQLRSATAEQQARSENVAAAREALDRCSRARAELAHLSDLADAALSKHAAQMRSVLVEGEPCPVCGALEHPFTHGEDTATELARGIKSRRADLDTEMAELTKTLTEAETARSRAAGQASQAAETLGDAEPQLQRAQARLATLLPVLRGHAAIIDAAPSLPEHVEDLADEAIERLRTVCGAARAAVAQRRRQAKAIMDEIEQLRLAEAQAMRRLDAALATRDGERQALESLKRDETVRSERMAGWGEQLARMRQELTPFLVAAGIAASDLDRDTRVVQRRVATVVAAYRTVASEHEAASELIAKLATDIGLAEKERSHKVADRTRLQQQVDTLRHEVEAARATRAGLLGGADTHTHRQAAIDRQKQVRETVQAARDESARAGLASVRAQTARESAIKARQAATAQEAEAAGQLAEVAARAGAHAQAMAAIMAGASDSLAPYTARREELAQAIEDALATLVLIRDARQRDDEARQRVATVADEIAGRQRELEVWQAVNAAVGQADGAKFRRFAQSVTLAQLIELANVQLSALNPRYRLERGALSDLALDVVDRDMGEEVRSPRSLSGGERFLVSLALALALSGLEGRQSFVDTLFIDEGFGSLDGETLDVAIGALESLQGQGRKVGVITHVAAMVEQIAVQVRVEKRGSGRSAVRVVDGSASPA
jgi:exonuclease SbcC